MGSASYRLGAVSQRSTPTSNGVEERPLVRLSRLLFPLPHLVIFPVTCVFTHSVCCLCLLVRFFATKRRIVHPCPHPCTMVRDALNSTGEGTSGTLRGSQSPARDHHSPAPPPATPRLPPQQLTLPQHLFTLLRRSLPLKTKPLSQ